MTSLASVFVEVRPDTSHFSNDLKSSLAKTREAVEVAATLDTAKLKPQLDRLKTDLKSITVTKANITADSARASATVRGLKQELKGLSEKVKLEGDSTDLSNRITAVKAELKSVSDEKVRLSVDSSAASAHIKALTAQLSVFSREEDRAGGGRDGGGLGGHLAGIASGFADAGAAMGSIMTKAGMVGPALLAAGAAASSAASAGVALAGAMGPVAAAGIAAYGGTMLAVKQGMGVVKFATEGLTDAIGGDEKAMKKLTPAGRDLARQLKAMKPEVEGVRQAAQAGLFPGVADAARRLATNYFPLLRTAARQTGTSMGGLAERAGLLATSGPWKRDFGTVTSTNARNLSVLGTIGLSLADVFRNLLVTSLPLTTAFLRWGAGAARALQGVTQAGRNSGALAGFWERAAAAGATFGRIVGNVGVALFNVFRIGSSPTGRNLLVVVEGLTARFREWTTSANGAKTIADWFAQGRTNVAAIGRLVGAVFGGMRDMGSGAAFAPLVDQIRTQVLPPLMAFLHNASASGALQALVTAVGNIIGVFAQLSASDQSLKAFAATLGALARAAGWIVENIPGASQALGAFFVLMGANQALRVVGLGGAVQQLGGFMVSLATATGRAAAAEKAQAFWTGVQTVAGRVAAGAARVWAGAQWLLNAALTANPIGLVVVGIAALAAGFILAYRKSETFRNIVQGALGGVSDAAQAVVRWFRRSFIPFFTDTIPGAFHATISWVRRNWPVILAVLTGPVGLATLFISRHWDTITRAFQDAKDWVVGRFRRAWSDVQGVVLTPIRNARDAIRDVFGSSGPVRRAFTGVKDWATGTFRRAWSALQGVILDPLRNARDAIRDIFGSRGPVRTAFSNAVDGIRRIWSNLRDAVRAPIAFIVNTVFNRGIVPFVNRIPFIPGELHTIQGFAGGGYTGPGGKYEPAGIVHSREHVIRSESTESVNRAAPGFLDHLNKRGAAALRGVLPGYWLGGGVKPAAGAVSQHGGYPWARWAGDINEPGSSDIGHPVHAWKAGIVASVQHLLTSYGNHIRLNHPGNERTLYAHLSRTLVNVGQHVAQNQVIGLKGGTGNASGPHLHFEISGGTNPIVGTGGNQGAGGGVPGYAGPSAADARASLNPAAWLRRLRGMGPWGGALGGMVSGVVGNLRDAVVTKIEAVVKAAGDFLLTGGTGQFDANASGVWKALRAAGWNQAAAAGIMGNIQYESGFSPTVIQGGSHGTPAQAGSRGYGLVQWTPATKIANMLNGRAPTVGNEIAALTGELRRGYGPLVHQMQGAKSPVAAAMAFLHGFERPANPNQPQRGTAATAWFNRFARKNGAFDDGGVARGRGVILKDTPERERVLSPQETNSYDRLLPLLERLERGGTGTGPMRIVLDAGGGVTLTGHIDNRILGRRAQSATVGRQYR